MSEKMFMVSLTLDIGETNEHLIEALLCMVIGDKIKALGLPISSMYAKCIGIKQEGIASTSSPKPIQVDNPTIETQ